MEGARRSRVLVPFRASLRNLSHETSAWSRALGVGPADHHDDELRVAKHEFVPHRRFEKIPVLVDPLFKVECSQLSHRIPHEVNRSRTQRQDPKTLCAFALSSSSYSYFTQTFLGSVKKRSASKPPSRPTPDCFIPPIGVLKSRRSQVLTQTNPEWIRSAIRWHREMS